MKLSIQITLSNRVDSNALLKLLNNLSEVGDATHVKIDFKNLLKITPAGLVLLASWVNNRISNSLSTKLINLDKCHIKGYLQRMNLLSVCEVSGIEENFQRHDPRKRFVPLREIDCNTDELAAEVADLIAPGGDEYDHQNMGLWDAAQYVVTELTNNVQQHGRGRGFIAAQTTQGDGMVRIAVCDDGIGIRQSLLDGRLDMGNTDSDTDCILKALSPRVSSKGQPSNEGVGLTLTSQTVSLMGGQMLICSGNGVVITQLNGQTEIPEDLPMEGIQGALVTLVFKQSKANDGFNECLHRAKVMKDLLQNTNKPVISFT